MDIETEIIVLSAFGLGIAIVLGVMLPSFFRAMNEKEWDVTPDFWKGIKPNKDRDGRK